ncbi:putative voltage-gated sodium channel FPC1 alpha subunit-like protein, partial [Leptotrombidium deliense]
MNDESSTSEGESPFRLYSPFSLNEHQVVAEQANKPNEPNSELEDGRQLPQRLANRFQSSLAYKQLEEIDSYYKQSLIPTFIVIDSCREIHRYTSTRSLFVFGPQNVIRRFAISVESNVGFQWFIYLTVFTYIMAAMYPPSHSFEKLEVAMLVFWMLELAIKIIARGFLLTPFSYLRNDFRNRLDFFAIISLILNLVAIEHGSFGALRGFRLIDPFRRGIRLDIILLKCFRSVHSVLVYFIIVAFVIALFGLQAFMGLFRSRCAIKPPFALHGYEWFNWYLNPKHWVYGEILHPQMCSNYTLIDNCGSGDVLCVPSIGENPDYGYTNFDTLGWSMLSTIRLLTLDYVEELYRLVYTVTGFKCNFFFIPVTFFVAVFFNSLFAVVVVSVFKNVYNETFSNTVIKIQAVNGITGENGMIEHQQSNSVLERMKGICCRWSCVSCCPGIREKFKRIITDPYVELFFKLCIFLNTICLCMDHHDMSPALDGILQTMAAFFNIVFLGEVCLKIVLLTPGEYFADFWNRWDFTLIVLYLIFAYYSVINEMQFFGFTLFRIFKLINFLSYFNKLMLITTKSFKLFSRILYSFVMIVITFAIFGLTAFGASYKINAEFFHKGIIPRWNYTDFIHAFMNVFRIICGEWIETLWDCMLVSGYHCIPLYIFFLYVGKYVLVNIFLGIILRNHFRHTTNPKDAESPYFNYAVIIIIFVSCVLLGLDDKYTHTRKSLHDVLRIMDLIILLLFMFEMVFKWMAYGFRGYFSSKLNILDFIVNFVWVLEMFIEFTAFTNGIATFHTIRVLRIFRIIDVTCEDHEMKLIVNTFWKSLPGIANAIFVILVSWLVYAIIGVQLFGGRFYYCYDFVYDTVVNVSIVSSKPECLLKNYTWVNAEMNFDHIFNAYLSLLEIATLKGHLHVMHSAFDGHSVSSQPIYEINLYSYFYFFFFIIVGSFLTLNLFFGVIYTTYKELRQQLEMSRSSLFTQNNVFNNAMRKVRLMKPKKAIPPPQSLLLQKLFYFVQSELYEAIIVIFILANLGILTYDNYYFVGKSYDVFWEVNNGLIFVFVVDCALKMLAFRQYFFTRSWPLLDLTIVMLQLI